jgi:hypothetical protein
LVYERLCPHGNPNPADDKSTAAKRTSPLKYRTGLSVSPGGQGAEGFSFSQQLQPQSHSSSSGQPGGGGSGADSEDDDELAVVDDEDDSSPLPVVDDDDDEVSSGDVVEEEVSD